MRLWLTPEQAQTITRQALKAAPGEVCGLIGGVGARALRIVEIPNDAADPTSHYQLNEEAFVRTMFAFESAGLSLLGIYHSHPQGDPIPSETDIAEAAYPDTAYVIIGLRHSPELAAWQIRNRDVTTFDLYVGVIAPEPEEPPLLPSQKRAIIAAALAAFIFMLVLSLSLLPPAPVIVTP